MIHGARNRLKCKIVGVKKGDVMSQLKLEIIDGNKMGSVITTESLEEMGVGEGDEITVVVKAINVLPVKE